jgi:outer membrane receptor protein involved in Fe transport
MVGPGELALNAKYSYIDDMETITTNDSAGSIGSQDRVDASIDYVWERYRFTVFGRNLTDEIAVGAANISGLMTFGSPSPGRSWGVEVSASLGGE